MRHFALALALLLGGCVGRAPPPAMLPQPAAVGDPAAWFDCLRSRSEAVVSAHRAGPAPGLPENALETMAATLAANPAALLEIDVRQAADGTLFLLHDDRLDRTTTGSGLAHMLDRRAIADLRLRDDAGMVTAARLPLLADALALAVERGALVQLDIKRGVDFAAVIAAVRSARATRHAIIIAYNDADALTVARLAPELMISASVDSLGDAERLIAAGVARDRLLAWTGTRAPDAGLFAALRGLGVEPLFGTLGRPATRLDDRWLADGDPREFVDLEAAGAVVVATDRPVEVAAALGPPTCPR